MNLTEKDTQQLASKGISVAKLQAQLNDFRTGFPYLKLAGSAVKGNGIQQLNVANIWSTAAMSRNLYPPPARHRVCSRTSFLL